MDLFPKSIHIKFACDIAPQKNSHFCVEIVEKLEQVNMYKLDATSPAFPYLLFAWVLINTVIIQRKEKKKRGGKCPLLKYIGGCLFCFVLPFREP